MSTPLFLAPLRSEALALRYGAGEVELELIGKGPAAARAANARLLARDMDSRAVVLFGVAGALSATLHPGDIVVGSSVSALKGESTELPFASEVADALISAGLSVRLAPIISSPALVRGRQQRAKLALRADAVDMESAWCAPLARRFPFVVVRAIVDTPDFELFSLRMLQHGLSGLRSLAHAARVLRNWSPATLSFDPLTEASDL